MVVLSTSIEINSSPARVRETFLDFNRIGKWQSFFKSIEVVEQKSPNGLQPGDQVKVAFSSMSMVAPITQNSSSLFQWAGGLKFIFLGRHSFSFEPSKVTPGSTTFTNSEEFSGLLGFLMGPFGKSTIDGWNEFNRRLKARVEERP